MTGLALLDAESISVSIAGDGHPSWVTLAGDGGEVHLSPRLLFRAAWLVAQALDLRSMQGGTSEVVILEGPPLAPHA